MSTGKTTMAQGNETKRNLHICNICNAWNVQNILEKLIIKEVLIQHLFCITCNNV